MLLQDAEGQEGFGCISPEMQIVVHCRRATPKMLDSADAVVWHKRESLTQDLLLCGCNADRCDVCMVIIMPAHITSYCSRKKACALSPECFWTRLVINKSNSLSLMHIRWLWGVAQILVSPLRIGRHAFCTANSELQSAIWHLGPPGRSWPGPAILIST